MSLTIGFGSTEQDFEEAEIEAFKEHCRTEYLRRGVSYISDEMAGAVEEWVRERATKLLERYDGYRNSDDYPSRYSIYYISVLTDASHVVAIYRFSHINRRHALSPDGWAIMNTERVEIIFDTVRGDENIESATAPTRQREGTEQ